jgi:xanthine dehydrogenase accessory factor
MHDILADVERWLAAGQAVALATVVETWGSAPRGVGAKMALTDDGDITGSVSGGCVEAAVVEAGQEALRSGPRLLRFGVADETAWEVGLACGGQIAVFVEALDREMMAFARDVMATEARGVVATVIAGPLEWVGRKLLWRGGSIEHSTLPDGVVADVMQHIRAGDAGRVLPAGDMSIFLDVLRPSPLLIIIGGAHIAVALVRLATTLGYRTVVVDPRRAFGRLERFPEAGRLMQAWPAKALTEIAPTSDAAVVTLTHDPKIDDPALFTALASEAFYIGALGSRRTHAERCERLAGKGVSADALARIRAPVGLDIGAQNPEEIALAILAEIVAAYRGR